MHAFFFSVWVPLTISHSPTGLVGPYRAILRYYRCDTPYRAILFKGSYRSPKMVRYPPFVLSFTQAHLCDTPFCYVSRDNCSRPDPCSVDFGPETPKFCFENCRGFWVDFFLLFFPRKKARKNPPKNPRQNSPGNSVGKIPLGFLQNPFLDNCAIPH